MNLSFKVTFGSDVRRFTLPLREESYLLRQVMVLLGKLYDLNDEQIKNLELKYVDNEGDLITVGAPCDLKEAFNHMADGLMRLHAKVGDRQRIQFTDIITTDVEYMKFSPPPSISKQETGAKENKPQSFANIPNYSSIPITIPIKKQEPMSNIPSSPMDSPIISPPIHLSNSPIVPPNSPLFSSSPIIPSPLSESPVLVSNSPIQKLDLSKLQSNDAPVQGVNSSRGSQTITSSRGGSVIIKGGCSVSTTYSGNVSTSHAGGSVAITRQGSGVIAAKGSSLVVQKK